MGQSGQKKRQGISCFTQFYIPAVEGAAAAAGGGAVVVDTSVASGPGVGVVVVIVYIEVSDVITGTVAVLVCGC